MPGPPAAQPAAAVGAATACAASLTTLQYMTMIVNAVYSLLH
jgi:hypothetical protein